MFEIISGIIKAFSIVMMGIFAYNLKKQQKTSPTSPRQRMINFLISGMLIIFLELIKPYVFNMEIQNHFIAFYHTDVFIAAIFYIFALDWSLSLRAVSESENFLVLVDKNSYKFLVLPFIVNLLLMSFSFVMARRLFGGDFESLKQGYKLIILFFKIMFLFIVFTTFLLFPRIKNLKYMKYSMFFLLLARFSNLILYAYDKKNIDEILKYFFVFPSVLFGIVSMVKMFRDKKRGCDESHPCDD